MQCPACSTENPAGAMYCQRCGTALAAASDSGFSQSGAPQPGVPQPGYTPVGGGYTQVPQSGPAMPGQAIPASGPGYAAPGVGGLSDSAAGAIAYMTFIPAVIFLVMEPYSRRPFVRFHAFQCIFLTAASVLLHFAITLSMVAMLPASFVFS